MPTDSPATIPKNPRTRFDPITGENINDQLIDDQSRTANSLNMIKTNDSYLLNNISPLTEVEISDNHDFEKDSQQLYIDSIQNQKHMLVQKLNEIPQFLLQEVGFEDINDQNIRSISELILSQI